MTPSSKRSPRGQLSSDPFSGRWSGGGRGRVRSWPGPGRARRRSVPNLAGLRSRTTSTPRARSRSPAGHIRVAWRGPPGRPPHRHRPYGAAGVCIRAGSGLTLRPGSSSCPLSRTPAAPRWPCSLSPAAFSEPRCRLRPEAPGPLAWLVRVPRGLSRAHHRGVRRALRSSSWRPPDLVTAMPAEIYKNARPDI